MSTNIYVGNLAFSTDSDALRKLFADFGEVTSAQVIADRILASTEDENGCGRAHDDRTVVILRVV